MVEDTAALHEKVARIETAAAVPKKGQVREKMKVSEQRKRGVVDLAELSLSEQVQRAISMVDGGKSNRRVTLQEVRAQGEGRKSRKWRRRHGFMGPIINGGKEGWTRAVNILLDTLGLAMTPVRVGWEGLAWTASAFGRVLRFVTPRFIAERVTSAWSWVSRPLWMNVGLPIYTRWLESGYRRSWLHIWNTPSAYYNYYFPTLDMTWERPGARMIRDAVAAVKVERESWAERAAAARGALASSHDLGPGKIFLDMLGRCFALDQQGYRYELCPFHNATQSGTVLGRWQGWNGKLVDGRPMSQYTSMGFTEGTPCFGGQRCVVHGVQAHEHCCALILVVTCQL